jgi:mannose/fructose/N-acetylgalactosamine-specific phosphotransferase system component IIC
MTQLPEHRSPQNQQYWEDRKWDGLFLGFVVAVVFLLVCTIGWAIFSTMIAGMNGPEYEQVQVCTQTSETTEICRDKWIEVDTDGQD